MSQEVKVLVGIGIATVLIIIGAVFFMGREQSSQQAPQVVDASTLVKEDSHRIGSESASVTLVEFGDFECPACQSAYPTIKRLEGEFGDQMQFVFRNYPLAMHPNAFDAALAAESAGEQDKFFEMHDLLFENQTEWSGKSNAKEIFSGYADQLGLDTEQFREDMESAELEEKVNTDVADGNAAGVRSTPTFFINGKRQAGSLPYDQFKSLIEAEIN